MPAPSAQVEAELVLAAWWFRKGIQTPPPSPITIKLFLPLIDKQSPFAVDFMGIPADQPDSLECIRCSPRPVQRLVLGYEYRTGLCSDSDSQSLEVRHCSRTVSQFSTTTTGATWTSHNSRHISRFLLCPIQITILLLRFVDCLSDSIVYSVLQKIHPTLY